LKRNTSHNDVLTGGGCANLLTVVCRKGVMPKRRVELKNGFGAPGGGASGMKGVAAMPCLGVTRGR